MNIMNEAINNSELGGILHLTGQPTYFHISGKDFNITDKIRRDIIKFFYEKNILFKGTISISLSHTDSHIEQLGEVFLKYCNEFNFSKITTQ